MDDELRAAFEGKTPEELIAALVPAGWQKLPSRVGDGVRYFDGKGNQVRVMYRDPTAPDPGHRGPYALVSFNGDKTRILLAGNSGATVRVMKKHDKKVAILETLWAGHEDWTGLWEVVWRLQTIWPELRGGPAEQEARTLLCDLLDQGFIYLCLLDEDTNRETRLSNHEAVELLKRPDALDAPASAHGQFRFVTTDEGEAEIRRLGEAGVKVVW